MDVGSLLWWIRSGGVSFWNPRGVRETAREEREAGGVFFRVCVGSCDEDEREAEFCCGIGDPSCKSQPALFFLPFFSFSNSLPVGFVAGRGVFIRSSGVVMLKVLLLKFN